MSSETWNHAELRLTVRSLPVSFLPGGTGTSFRHQLLSNSGKRKELCSISLDPIVTIGFIVLPLSQ